tara:strand:+ start:1540 stop:1965 length:426 start_codon:yes stop_codon:yes gene_type:complete
MNLTDLKKRMSDLVANKEKIALQVVDDEAIDILQNRLEEGKDSKGGSFPEYADQTIAIKRIEGGFLSQSGNIAWKDTGGFYRSMFLNKQEKFIEIDSQDSNYPKIAQRAPDVLDVSEQENNEIFENKRDEIVEVFRKFLLN